MRGSRMLRAACAAMALMIALGAPAMAAGRPAAKGAAKPKPTKVVLSSVAETILPGAALQLTAAVLPDGASQSVVWRSSNPSVASVNGKGQVVGKKRGTAKITATAKSGGKKSSCAVRVSTALDGVGAHFYGIGNANYQDEVSLPGSAWDVEAMAELYRGASFAGSAPSVHEYHDLTGAGIVGVLDAMAADAAIGEDDVTVFYYSGHGCWASGTAYHGALVGVDGGGAADANLVTVDAVQRRLDRVPGTVVVILDSCYSGAFIRSKGISLQSAAGAANAAWIRRCPGAGRPATAGRRCRIRRSGPSTGC